MKYISLFSGIEAASVAWEGLGWQPLAFAEIEPFPSAVLAHHYPEVPNLGDVSKIDWSQYAGKADVLIGGSPCQSFSVAGLRKGLTDPRGNLMLEWLRAVNEVRPKWVIWENVPGVLSSGGGRDFTTLLTALGDIGYGFAYRVLDAQFFGVPQRRRRVFVVGHLGNDWRASARVLFEPTSLRWNSETSAEARKRITTDAERCIGESSEPIVMAPAFSKRPNQQIATNEDNLCYAVTTGEPSRVLYRKSRRAQSNTDYETWVETDTTNTLNCFDVGDIRSTDLVVEMPIVRRLTSLECERLQGFPDNWTQTPYRNKPAESCPKSPRYKALGNSMAVPVIKWLGERIQLVEEAV